MRARLLLTVLVLGGCTVDRAAHPAYVGCASDDECAATERCDRGFCVLAQGGLDGGERDAGAPDADPGDAGEPPPDAGCRDEIVCNGRDDDCDETVDEFPVPGCDTGTPGVCGDGQWLCSGGAPVCGATILPAPEACNSMDDDCDGDVDELAPIECYPSDLDGCTDDDGDGAFECDGVCRVGASSCAGGAFGECLDFVGPQADEVCTPDPETPARDEDCDGVIDEGCSCVEDQACYGGPDGTQGVGVCIGGRQTCEMGMLETTCSGQVLPGTETCANPMSDDDCDGVMDDIAGEGDPCVASDAVGQCQLGHRGCDGGSELVCLPAAPTMEACDGNDNDCDSSVDEGFDLSNDPMNCGACGNACGESETCCGGACVDVRTSDDHCGACATAGGASCGASEVCCNGACEDAASCGTCIEDCAASGRDCCRGACVDMDNDESHCGGCGIECGAGEVCCGGACVGSDASHCGQGCDVCESGDELCCTGACVEIGNTHCNACGVACTTGQCCDTGCVDLESDASNCGACGNTCPSGQVCSDGNCCPSGQTWCAAQGACRDLANDDGNCGACGRTCGALSACCGGACRGLSLGC